MINPEIIEDAAEVLAAAGFVTLERTTDQLIIRPTEKLTRLIDSSGITVADLRPYLA